MECSIITAGVWELREDGMEFMEAMCGASGNGETAHRTKEQYLSIWDRFFAEQSIHILTAPFGKECIQKEGFRFGNSVVPCDLFSIVSKKGLTGGYLYMMHSPVVDRGESRLDDFYIDTWQTALLDAAREWLKKHIITLLPEGQFLSDSVAPGFYGMEAGAAKVLAEQMEPERIGIRFLPSGMMEPVKSLIGIYLKGSDRITMPGMDCGECQPGLGCNFCRTGRVNQ